MEMSNEFKVGSRVVITACAEKSENHAWGFRVGDVAIVEDANSVPRAENPDCLPVGHAVSGMLGYFTRDQLRAE